MGEDTGRTDSEQPARGYRELDSSEGHADESTVRRNPVMFRTAHVGDTDTARILPPIQAAWRMVDSSPATRVKGSC